ncbi:MAG: hypothetical protein AAF639_21980, partial [Chloroflexota bacterium]
MKKVWYGVAAVAIAASSFGFVSQTSFGQDVQQEIQAQVAALRAGQASSLNEDNTLAMGEDSESNRILASAVASQTANDIPVVKASLPSSLYSSTTGLSALALIGWTGLPSSCGM